MLAAYLVTLDNVPVHGRREGNPEVVARAQQEFERAKTAGGQQDEQDESAGE
jgi:hypothetical protein